MTVNELMNIAPMDWEKTVDSMSSKEKDDMRRKLEGISLRAGELAGYLDERHGYGCGDQGHRAAVKEANRNGKIIWTKAFGYNEYHKITL
jgi:hypothetical protein